MSRPCAVVLSAPGTNRDHDVSFALGLAGADARIVLLAELLADHSVLASAQMLVVALRYAGGNPNGSVDDIAGVCDPSGVVLGLMPHPENHVLARQHPRRARGTAGGLGLQLFERGVAYARER